MAAAVTLGKLTTAKTRSSDPSLGSGDLYTLTIPLVMGPNRGELRAEFFVADARSNDEVLEFIGATVTSLRGPTVRWDL